MRKGEMLPSRRVEPDELSLGPRVLCRCGTSLRRRINRQRGACKDCYDGTDAAAPPPGPVTACKSMLCGILLSGRFIR